MDSTKEFKIKTKYRVEEHHYEYYNPETKQQEETPIKEEHVKKLFKNKIDCLRYFFSPRKRRDFCYGENYLQTNDVMEIYEQDEGGTSTYILYKWEGFDDEIKFRYTARNQSTDEVTKDMDWKALKQYCDRMNAYVYWEDDGYGHIGHLKNRSTEEDIDIEIESRYVR